MNRILLFLVSLISVISCQVELPPVPTTGTFRYLPVNKTKDGRLSAKISIGTQPVTLGFSSITENILAIATDCTICDVPDKINLKKEKDLVKQTKGEEKIYHLSHSGQTVQNQDAIGYFETTKHF